VVGTSRSGRWEMGDGRWEKALSKVTRIHSNLVACGQMPESFCSGRKKIRLPAVTSGYQRLLGNAFMVPITPDRPSEFWAPPDLSGLIGTEFRRLSGPAGSCWGYNPLQALQSRRLREIPIPPHPSPLPEERESRGPSFRESGASGLRPKWGPVLKTKAIKRCKKA